MAFLKGQDMLTFGMAAYDNASEVWFTLQNLRVYHGFKGPLIVVNNSPLLKSASDIKGSCNEWDAKYVAFDGPPGTSQARNRVIELAETPFVSVIDSHISFMPGSVANLDAYIRGARTTNDIIHGVLLMEGTKTPSTHMRDEWGPDCMWGRWGLAWMMYGDNSGEVFDVVPAKQTDKGDPEPGCAAAFQTVSMDPEPIHTIRGKMLPVIPWENHDKFLAAEGFVPAVGAKCGPYEIPAHGMGFWCTRKEAWPGFHPLATGFGGEEVTTQELYRDAGAKAICLPYVGWIHKWRDDLANPPYPMDINKRVRNYLLAADRCKRKAAILPRMVAALTKKVGPEVFKKIAADPSQPVEKSCSTCGGPAVPVAASIGELFTAYKGKKRDLDQHFDAISDLAAKCSHVTAFTKRREWDVCVLNGLPADGVFVSHNTEQAGGLQKALSAWAGERYTFDGRDSLSVDSIDETDLLILDTQHSAPRTAEELTRFAKSVRKYILLRSTATYGDIAESPPAPPNTPGMFIAMRAFLRDNPEWTVIYHTAEQWGYTVLSRDPADRKELPSLIKQGMNIAAALTRHVTKGGGTTDEKTAQIRLDTCALCPLRAVENCSQCGCYLLTMPNGKPGKAFWPHESCPRGYWAEAEKQGKPIVPAM